MDWVAPPPWNTHPYDVLAFTLTQKCSAQCEKQVSLFTGGTCFACFNIEGI